MESDCYHKKSKTPTLVKPLTDLQYDREEYKRVETQQFPSKLGTTMEQPKQMESNRMEPNTTKMTKALITDQMLRWKLALEMAQESSPSSAANCFVSGYIHGLQYALEKFPDEAKEGK